MCPVLRIARFHYLSFVFELGFEEAQEVVDDTHGNGLDAIAGFAGGPSFAFVELLFLRIEGIFNVPA